MKNITKKNFGTAINFKLLLLVLSFLSGAMIIGANLSPVSPRASAATTCVPPPAGLVGWWTGNGNANDSSGNGNNGSLQGTADFAEGKVGQGFRLDEDNESVLIPSSPSLDVGLGGSLTLEAWINPTSANPNFGYGPIFEWNLGNGVQLGRLNDNILFANLQDTTGANHFLTANNVIAPNQFQHVALTYSNITGMGIIYVNGVLVVSQNMGSFTPRTNTEMRLGSRGAQSFTGIIDEASVYNRALTDAEILAIYNAGSAGKCNGTCPTITLDPSSLSGGTVGSSYNQTITADGGVSPYTYSITNGSLPSGLSLDSSTGEISGTPVAYGNFGFTVTAADTNGCTGSQSYSVEIICPTITLNPDSLANGSVGTSYSQTVSASGGTNSYTYSISSGSLPAGLTLNQTTGEISGMPTTSGTNAFTVTATDGNGCLGSHDYSITVFPVTAAYRCPLPQGYWKKNSDVWAVNSLTLGSQTYTQAELLAIFNTPVGSGKNADASLILAYQLIAAKLNLANGSDPLPVSGIINTADNLLSIYTGKLPYQVKPSSLAGQNMTNTASLLESYNKGLLTPVCNP